MSLTARNVVRRFAQRNINWSSPVFREDPEVASIVSAFRSWAASAEAMAEKYASPPSPINFSKAKESIRDKSLVEALEKLYTNSKPPAETYTWSEEDRADKAKKIEAAKDQDALTKEMIDVTQKEVAYLMANRTTMETTSIDVLAMYPDMADEVETELENREWFKDIDLK